MFPHSKCEYSSSLGGSMHSPNAVSFLVVVFMLLVLYETDWFCCRSRSMLYAAVECSLYRNIKTYSTGPDSTWSVSLRGLILIRENPCQHRTADWGTWGGSHPSVPCGIFFETVMYTYKRRTTSVISGGATPGRMTWLVDPPPCLALPPNCPALRIALLR